VPYRPGQYVAQDVISRVDFGFMDVMRLLDVRESRRELEPRVYKPAKDDGDAWLILKTALLELPSRVAGKKVSELPADLVTRLQVGEGSESVLEILGRYHSPEYGEEYRKAVDEFIKSMSTAITLPRDKRDEELAKKTTQRVVEVVIAGKGNVLVEDTYSAEADAQLLKRLNEAPALKNFHPTIAPRIAWFSLTSLGPTHVLDEQATIDAQNKAAERVPASEANVQYRRNQVLWPAGRVLTEEGWSLLKAEKHAFNAGLGHRIWKNKAGLIGLVVIIVGVLAVYVYRYQKRVVRNRMRSIAIGALMIAMLLLAQLAAIGTGPLYIFGVAPTILVAMILTIAYDQRFAVGVASMHGMLVTIAIDQGVGFYIILWAGVFTCCFMLNEIRNRSKLIEVGAATALAMMAATLASGLIQLDPLRYIRDNCLFVGAAGLGVGFVVLGILPFIERTFKITTAMTLLELADASQPLLKRLALEAPGTYNHSLQVATLAEAAVDAIGGNSLLARVGAYYHDIGKVNKPDYFVENQIDGRNRHKSISPSVSLLVIIGHVKDGIELAKEYNLPTSVLPFIQQHHGTTLIEYFYRQACAQEDQTCDEEKEKVPEEQYRYPGPKPKSKEIAILMICDAVESAVRAMREPNASRVEQLVHDLVMKRLNDGQFDECELTFSDLQKIERACVKTLLGIYHGRIAYPTEEKAATPKESGAGMAVRTA
jgi:putative nucleotidyltransferase with HDIG domain